MKEGLIYAAVSTYLIAASGMSAAQAAEVTSNPSDTHSAQHYQNSMDPAQELGPPQDVNPGNSGSSFMPKTQSEFDARRYRSIREIPGFEGFQPLPVWVGDVGYDCDPALDCSLDPNTIPTGIFIFGQHRRR